MRPRRDRWGLFHGGLSETHLRLSEARICVGFCGGATHHRCALIDQETREMKTHTEDLSASRCRLR